MSAEERRELVLEAALGEFAARGLAGTSTEEVARRAGISQPYLFRLFATKRALFLALVRRCFDRLEETFSTAAADLTGQDALMAMADAYERLLDDRLLLLLQMQAYAACEDPEVRATTRAGFKHLWELVERLTGLPFQPVVDFFAVGMLMNVAAAMDLPAVDERWTSWCPKDYAAGIFFDRKLVTTHFFRRQAKMTRRRSMDLRDHVGRAVHGVARQPRGDHGTALDPGAPACLARGAAVDGQRVHADVRRAAAHRGDPGRALRPPAAVRHRTRPVHRRFGRRRARPGHRRAGCRAGGPGRRRGHRDPADAHAAVRGGVAARRGLALGAWGASAAWPSPSARWSAGPSSKAPPGSGSSG